MKDFKTISVKGMTKRFGEKVAVNDFSLEFGKGEFVTFLGPSGCGKSTALNCITGLIPITSGEIWIDDECIDDSRTKIPAEKREFGMVFQNYALFPHLSVFENVAFGLRLRRFRRSEIAERVDTALRLVHLEGYASKFPSQMSGGEQQRVAIARCIVLEPRLLLLDEPLSNLDAKLRIELRYELKALHERLRVTTIYVTHDQTEALALSDRIVVLRLGKIQQVGTPAEVFSDPANLFVADFMGFKNMWTVQVTSLRELGTGLEAELDAQGLRLTARLAWPGGDPRRGLIEEARRSGTPMRTAIRPEDISVANEASTNRLDCEASIVEYQGQASQVSAMIRGTEGADGVPLRADLRTGARIAEGERFIATVPADRLLVFPATLTAAEASGWTP
ncbi:MAG TPA: ABC transporter ATP-binding protein [Rectinemataceae bacterium]|nr:ABC transporter ATP-binding protein [Rectinemataceae bacterium]